jgi:tetratricopeptide (TPR) repeat protein
LFIYLFVIFYRALENFTKALFVSGSAGLRLSDRALVLGNRAAAYFMLDRYIEAIEDCEAALRIDVNLFKLHLRAGRAHLKLGHFSQAEACFNKVIQMNEFNEKNKDEVLISEAMETLTNVNDVREILSKVSRNENLGAFDECLRQVDRVLLIAPHCQVACVSKGKTLNQLRKYDVTKSFYEGILAYTHPTILYLKAHPSAKLPLPASDSLSFHLSVHPTEGSDLMLNVTEVTKAILFLGSELGKVYFSSIKNTSYCHNHSSDVMNIVSSILSNLSKQTIGAASWSWVETQLNLVRTLISRKVQADRYFRDNLFEQAVMGYTDTIKLGIDASRWQAILLSNRAATYMRLGGYHMAVCDCHQAIGLDPEYARAYLRRARAYVVMINIQHLSYDIYLIYIQS